MALQRLDEAEPLLRNAVEGARCSQRKRWQFMVVFTGFLWVFVAIKWQIERGLIWCFFDN